MESTSNIPQADGNANVKADIARHLIGKRLHLVPLWPVDDQGRCTCGKPDCDPKQASKHPKWTRDHATPHPDWWETNPQDAVGIDRRFSRIVSVEDDGDLDEWCLENDIVLTPTFTMISPSGRKRYFYGLPDDCPQGNYIKPDGWSVDILCLGRAPGPGTRRKDGSYLVTADGDLAVAYAPDALVTWLRDKAEERESSRADEVPAEKPDEIPASVQALIDRNPLDWAPGDHSGVDRSAVTFAVVGACYDAGLSQENAVWIAERQPDICDKFEGRHGGVAGEVANCWTRLERKMPPEPEWLEAGDEPTLDEWCLAQPVKRWMALAKLRGIPTPTVGFPQMNGGGQGPSQCLKTVSGAGETPAGLPERPTVPDGMNLDAMYSQWLSEPRLGPSFKYLEPYFKARQASEQAAREAQQQRQPSRYDQLEAALLDADGLGKIPAPVPLVSGWLYKDSLAWMGGKPGNCKSFAALDFGCCVATGLAWHQRPVAQGPVLYVIAEGVAGLSPRVAAWEELNDRKADGIWFLPVRVQIPDTNDLNALEKMADRLKPTMIIFDTQAKVSVGLDENSAKDMGEFVNRLEWLREQTRACLLVIHHQPRNAENLRGSTALEGAANTIITAVKDGPLVTLYNDAAHGGKQKDATEAIPVKLALTATGKSAALTTNLATASVVLKGSDADVLNALRKLGSASVPQLVDVTEKSRATVYRSLLELISQGQAIKTGSDERPRYAPVSVSNGDETPPYVGDEMSQPSQVCLNEETASDQGSLNRLKSVSDEGQRRLMSHTPIGGETGARLSQDQASTVENPPMKQDDDAPRPGAWGSGGNGPPPLADEEKRQLDILDEVFGPDG